jgi:hypothetical protein
MQQFHVLCLPSVCMQHLVGCLAKVLDSRDNTSPEVAAAGMVINTMGYIDGLGYELLADAVIKLRVGSAGGRKCMRAQLYIDRWRCWRHVAACRHRQVTLQPCDCRCVDSCMHCWLRACTVRSAVVQLLQIVACTAVPACSAHGHWHSVVHSLLGSCCVALQADVVLVMDQDRLYTQLTERLKVSECYASSTICSVCWQ